jgi:hypothetical protein
MSTLPAFLNGQRARGWARSSFFWILPAAALALVVAWETDWGRQIVHAPVAPAAVDPAPLTTAVLPDYQIEGGLPAHGETVARTLFNATRRPAPVLAGEGGLRQFAAGQFQLVGTAVTGDHNVAFLKEAGGKSRVVRQGDEINGMRVAMVGPDRVKLALGDESEELFLKVAPGPKTTLAAAPPPPGAAAPAAAAAPAQPARPGPVRAAAAPAVPAQPQDTRAARRAARQAAATSGDATMSTGGDASGQTPAQGAHRRGR